MLFVPSLIIELCRNPVLHDGNSEFFAFLKKSKIASNIGKVRIIIASVIEDLIKEKVPLFYNQVDDELHLKNLTYLNFISINYLCFAKIIVKIAEFSQIY